jgi:hypothetical protein
MFTTFLIFRPFDIPGQGLFSYNIFPLQRNAITSLGISLFIGRKSLTCSKAQIGETIAIWA